MHEPLLNTRMEVVGEALLPDRQRLTNALASHAIIASLTGALLGGAFVAYGQHGSVLNEAPITNPCTNPNIPPIDSVQAAAYHEIYKQQMASR